MEPPLDSVRAYTRTVLYRASINPDKSPSKYEEELLCEAHARIPNRIPNDRNQFRNVVPIS